ncbi:MAG: indole-3-glycerol phosphate synthase TrpC, partial [Chitinophagaceae bacterium]
MNKNILDEITDYKRAEVSRRKAARSVSELEKSSWFLRETFSLRQSLLDASRTGIIAEFKRRSPSKGLINGTADVAVVTRAYAEAGAAGLSVLTDERFFGGSDEDLLRARDNSIPLLRKEFIVDEYQIVEAKSIGADAILLIAACLTPAEVKTFSGLAGSLGLEVLLELHAESELDHVCAGTELVGINNRDLKTFSVDMERSLRMAERIPAGKVRIAESGISSVDDLLLFK